MNLGLRPKCGNCGRGYSAHVKGRACDNYEPKKGLAQVSEKQEEDQEVLNRIREAHLSLQHEIYGGTICEAKGKLKHICLGGLVLDHVELKATRALKFDPKNTQILCEVANGLKGSKRTDYRTPEIKKTLAERWPNGWE